MGGQDDEAYRISSRTSGTRPASASGRSWKLWALAAAVCVVVVVTAVTVAVVVSSGGGSDDNKNSQGAADARTTKADFPKVSFVVCCNSDAKKASFLKACSAAFQSQGLTCTDVAAVTLRRARARALSTDAVTVTLEGAQSNIDALWSKRSFPTFTADGEEFDTSGASRHRQTCGEAIKAKPSFCAEHNLRNGASLGTECRDKTCAFDTDKGTCCQAISGGGQTCGAALKANPSFCSSQQLADAADPSAVCEFQLCQKSDTKTCCRSVNCRPDGKACAAGAVTVAKSAKQALLVLYRVSGAGGAKFAIARSYDGYDWEPAVAGSADLEVSGGHAREAGEGVAGAWSCPAVSPSHCHATLAAHKSSGNTYVLEAVDAGAPPAAEAEAARFLTHATFGPTRASIDALVAKTRQRRRLGGGGAKLSAAVLAKYVKEQIALAPTLHRPYWRARTSPLLPAGATLPTGASKGPCEVGSRWRSYAFSDGDVGKTISVTSSKDPQGASRFHLSVDGAERTGVQPFPNITDSEVKGPYLICSVGEGPHRAMVISTDVSTKGCEKNSKTKLTSQNPPILFWGADALPRYAVQASNFVLSDLTRPLAGAKVLTSIKSATASDCSAKLAALPHAFVHIGSAFYIHEPRVVLVDNTLDSPASPPPEHQGTCPAVQKTFLNRRHCARHATCAPVEFTSKEFVLNEANLKGFYSTSSKYVYYIRGLRVGPGEDQWTYSPCTKNKKTRWMVEAGACAGGGTAIASADDKAHIAKTLSESTDTNPHVRDVTLSPGKELCDAKDAKTVGMKITVDGNKCFTHVHPQEFDVLDCSYWAAAHPGNDPGRNFLPITTPARTGSARLNYPTHAGHTMLRWRQKYKRLPVVGRFGDSIDFEDLPADLKTVRMADFVGATKKASGSAPVVSDACGSPAESASSPLLGHRYRMALSDPNYLGKQGLAREMTGSEGKANVFYSIALSAKDQLRQRVAWALSQIWVISESGLSNRGDEHEIWHTYRDIFVRHAFGNYKDIMREVSYSPAMATYLTFLQNKARDASGSSPDENYAREIMQLFSVGLNLLHADGTPVLDAKGEKIPTYDNDDIVAFARVWTGFDRQPFRGNIEARYGLDSRNEIDPMKLNPAWRDVFPVKNLYDGYIGDAYPLCAELPPLDFLRKGALWRNLGTDAHAKAFESPASVATDSSAVKRLEPDPARSALYAALCAKKGGKCTFPDSVELAAPLACHGDECSVQEPRVVKIASTEGTAWFEYVRRPCVRLAFAPSYKRLKRRSQGLQMCADPATAVAGAGCVTKPTISEFPSCKPGCVSGSGNQIKGRVYKLPDGKCLEATSTCRSCLENVLPKCSGNKKGTTADERAACDALTASADVLNRTKCEAMLTAANASACTFTAAAKTLETYKWHLKERDCARPYTAAATQLREACFFMWEHVTFAEAERRCAAAGMEVAFDEGTTSTANPQTCLYDQQETWVDGECTVQVEVTSAGRVGIVHSWGNGKYEAKKFTSGSGNVFSVRWHHGRFPRVAAPNGCGGGCTKKGATCVCATAVTTEAVFTDRSVPSAKLVEARLSIGAADPASFDAGKYTLCDEKMNAACVSTAEVKVWVAQGKGAAPFDTSTIFELKVNGTKTTFFANKRSTVVVGSGAGAYSFRNPPHFMGFNDAATRDAEAQTEAVLEHLFRHPNVAPFVAYRMIQRFVTSNPSPRYVKAVATAFSTGAYGGETYGGAYGDMGALVAAMLLDREARSHAIEADPAHGRVREPLLKVLHALRAMEYAQRAGLTEVQMDYLATKTGQEPFAQPTVFNFFLPEFQPLGPVRDAGLVAPETQLNTAPLVIAYLRGISSLARYGLTPCDYGFGSYSPPSPVAASDGRTTIEAGGKRNCRTWVQKQNPLARQTADGLLEYAPSSAKAADKVAGLDLLLTGARMNPNTTAVLTAEYERLAFEASGCFEWPACKALIGKDEPRFYGLSKGQNCFNTGLLNGDGTPKTPYQIKGKVYCLDANSKANAGQCFKALSWCQTCLPNVYAGTDGKKNVTADNYKSNLERVERPAACDTPHGRAEAWRHAQQLAMLSAEFNVLGNTNALSATTRPPAQKPKSKGRGYKAIVVLYLAGGADSWSFLVPHSQCEHTTGTGATSHAEYAKQRTNIAIEKSKLLPIEVPVAKSQPCDTFGMHPSFTNLQRLYNAGDAAWVANVGALVEPMTKDEYLTKTKKRPTQLYAHNFQTRQTLDVHAGGSYTLGILGRIVDAMADQGDGSFNVRPYSIAGTSKALESQHTPPDILSQNSGVVRYTCSENGCYAALKGAIDKMMSKTSRGHFTETYSGMLQRVLSDSEKLGAVVDKQTVDDASGFGTDSLAKQLKQVARVIKARGELDSERDVFFVQRGGWDTHTDAGDTVAENLLEVDGALAAFEKEMKTQGVWDKIAVVQASEFGRTFTSNGQGTDHAWGGNTFVVGGAVKGKQIHGKFPARIDEEGPTVVHKGGRLIPTTGWEAIWYATAQWFGVQKAGLPSVLPNLKNFDEKTDMIQPTDMFK